MQEKFYTENHIIFTDTSSVHITGFSISRFRALISRPDPRKKCSNKSEVIGIPSCHIIALKKLRFNSDRVIAINTSIAIC